MMRERMFATLGIWAAIAVAIDRLLASLSYTVWTEGVPQQVNVPGSDQIQAFATQIANTEFVSGFMQIAIFGIIVVALLCATGATIAIWESGHQQVQQAQQTAVAGARGSEKIKRTREMRVKRLLSEMDEEDLAELEAQHLNEDEMTVAQLMQQKRSTREM